MKAAIFMLPLVAYADVDSQRAEMVARINAIPGITWFNDRLWKAILGKNSFLL